MKSGIKKMAHERKEKKLIITHLEATGPMPLIKEKKTHAFDFSFTNCLNSFMSTMQYIPLSHEPLEPGSSNK